MVIVVSKKPAEVSCFTSHKASKMMMAFETTKSKLHNFGQIHWDNFQILNLKWTFFTSDFELSILTMRSSAALFINNNYFDSFKVSFCIGFFDYLFICTSLAVILTYTVKLARAKLPANARNFTCSSPVKRSLAQFTCVTCSLPVNTSKFTCFGWQAPRAEHTRSACGRM